MRGPVFLIRDPCPRPDQGSYWYLPLFGARRTLAVPVRMHPRRHGLVRLYRPVGVLPRDHPRYVWAAARPVSLTRTCLAVCGARAAMRLLLVVERGRVRESVSLPPWYDHRTAVQSVLRGIACSAPGNRAKVR